MNSKTVDIQNPLSIAECARPGPVQALLEQVLDTCYQACPGEGLRMCYTASRCASDCNDREGAALAQLFLAYARTQRCDLEEGIRLAERARANFRLRGDRHNRMVVHLFLARLKRALYNFDDSRLEYREALVLCRKLESEAKEIARSEAARFYGRIVEQIRRVLENLEIDRGRLLEITSVAPDGQSLEVNVLDTERNLICRRWMSAQEFRDRTAVSWLWEGMVAAEVDSPALKDLIREQAEQPTGCLVHAYLLSRIPKLLDPEIEDFFIRSSDLLQDHEPTSEVPTPNEEHLELPEAVIDVQYRDGHHLIEYVQVPPETEIVHRGSEDEGMQLIEHAMWQELPECLSRLEHIEGAQLTLLSSNRGLQEILRASVTDPRTRFDQIDHTELQEEVEGSEGEDAGLELENVRFELGWDPPSLEELFYREMVSHGISIEGSAELHQRILNSMPVAGQKKSLRGSDVRVWTSEMRKRYPVKREESLAVDSDSKAERQFLQRARHVWQRMKANPGLRQELSRQ